jgi:hypothetical protein
MRETLVYPLHAASYVPVVGTLVVFALSYRYAAALSPTLSALLPGTIALVSLLVVVGYLSRVLVSKESVPPAFSVGSSLRTGFVSAVVAGCFLTVPVALLLSTVLWPTGPSADGITSGSLMFLVSSTAAIVFFVAVAYVLPASIAAVMETNSLRSAVDSAAVGPPISSVQYLSAWTTGVSILGLGIAPLALAVASGDLLGVLGLFAGAYLLIAGTHVIAKGQPRMGGYSVD